jgi:CBS-domain-containing membrane protein
VSTEPLWWPPAKIVGRHLSPFLAGLEPTAAPPERAPAGAVAVEVRLDEAELVPPPPAPAVAREPDEPSAGDACSPGQVVAPADTVADVAEMLLARRHGAALVVEGDELIGIVTSTDLLRATAGRIPSGDATVREWMTAEPVVVDVDAGVVEAAALMARTGLSRLVVVEAGQPVGTVTRAQLERHGVPAAIGLGF